jgi:hypothetical protein
MKVLYKTKNIRLAIVNLLSASKGDRVVISAFVGAGSEIYFPKPKNIKLICWPQPGSTNPNTIRELMKRGVNVYFANKMHIKLYWTSDKGSVITSANLSSNALGSGGQIELGVLLPPGLIDINKVITNIKPKKVTESELYKLETAHHEFLKHNPKSNIRSTIDRSYIQWIESQTPEKWKFEVWEVANIKLSTNAQNLLLEEYGSPKCEEWMSANKDEIIENEWILCLRETTKRLGNAKWMFAHHVVRVPIKERKSKNYGFPYQVLQVSPIRLYEKPPFSLNGKRIQKAIKKAYRDTEQENGKPKKKFLNSILENIKNK